VAGTNGTSLFRCSTPELQRRLLSGSPLVGVEPTTVGFRSNPHLHYATNLFWTILAAPPSRPHRFSRSLPTGTPRPRQQSLLFTISLTERQIPGGAGWRRVRGRLDASCRAIPDLPVDFANPQTLALPKLFQINDLNDDLWGSREKMQRIALSAKVTYWVGLFFRRHSLLSTLSKDCLLPAA